MFEIQRRSAERPWAKPDPSPVNACLNIAKGPLVVRMCENRSQLTRDARIAIASIAFVLITLTILPALRGFWLVPVFALSAMAALTFALEAHARGNPASEVLELSEGRVRHRDSSGRTTELSAFWLRLFADQPTPAEMRLFLKGRDGALEFGRCLSLDERRELAPLMAAALAEARGI